MFRNDALRSCEKNICFNRGKVDWFFKKKLENISPFVGSLIPLLLTSGDICSGFQSQGGSSVTYFVARITMDSSDSPLVQHLLTFWWPALHIAHTCTFRLYIIQEFVGIRLYIIQEFVGIKPGIEFAEQCRVFVGEKLFTIKSQKYEAIKYFWTIQNSYLVSNQIGKKMFPREP